MKCLICQTKLIHQAQFGQLFAAQNPQLCPQCWAQFERIDGKSRCRACRGRFYHDESGPLCHQCEQWNEQYGWVPEHHALFTYNEMAKATVHQIKFLGDIALIDAFVQPTNEYFAKKMKKAKITAVPSHTERLKLRKIDVLQHFCQQLDYSFDNFLVKLLHTPHQSEQSRKERMQLDYPFRAIKPVPERIILIDDVYTTGATLYQAQLALKQAQKGKGKISTFSLFR